MTDLERRTEAAYALLPGATRLRERPSLVQRLATLVVGLLSLVLVASAVGGVWYHRWWAAEMGPRAVAPVSQVTASQTTEWEQAAAAARQGTTGVGAEPIVLSYHDIGDGTGRSSYAVSARSFESQMRMLQAAGYHTLSQSQLVAYLHGDFVPAARSAVITFDDGTRGLYTHADRILERYDFQAISFLISGLVGKRAPYYLTWAQVRSMERSGRWSFGGHTHDTHSQQADATGRTVRSALTSPLTTTSGTQETFAQFKRRINADQAAAFLDFSAHGLPKPGLFAWPFSEVQPEGPNSRYADYVLDLLNTRYDATLVNSAAPTPAGRSRSLSVPVQRLEVTGATTVDRLFTQMQQMQSLPLSSVRPAAGDTWIQTWDARQSAMAARGGLRPAGRPGASLPMDWRPQQTSDWTGYRATAVLRGLDHGRVGVRARVGSVDQVTLSASRGTVRVERVDRLTINPQPTGTDYQVDTGKTLRVGIEVRADSTVLRFAGRRIVVPLSSGADTTGGVGLYFSSPSGHAWPTVTDLQVAPLPST